MSNASMGKRRSARECKTCHKIRTIVRDDMCGVCCKRQEERCAKVADDPPYPWKQPTDKEIAGSLIGLILSAGLDIGEPSSPVVRYVPGTPEFDRVAAMYL